MKYVAYEANEIQPLDPGFGWGFIEPAPVIVLRIAVDIPKHKQLVRVLRALLSVWPHDPALSRHVFTEQSAVIGRKRLPVPASIGKGRIPLCNRWKWSLSRGSDEAGSEWPLVVRTPYRAGANANSAFAAPRDRADARDWNCRFEGLHVGVLP
jgi:hypothetical protein